jgi:hypothetical protein
MYNIVDSIDSRQLSPGKVRLVRTGPRNVVLLVLEIESVSFGWGTGLLMSSGIAAFRIMWLMRPLQTSL